MTTEHDNPELFKHLVQSVGEYAIFALDAQGHIITWNAGAQRAKGYTQAEILGKHFSIFYPPEAIAINHPQFELKEALEHGYYEEEGWRVRKDGSLFWAAVVINCLRDDSGNHLGFAKVTRDLSEKKKAELALTHSTKALERSEETFDLIVGSIKDYAILILSPEGQIMTWNEGAQRIKGYQADEIIGRHFSTFYTEEAVQANHPANELALALKQGSYEEEGWRVKKDGTHFWASVTITAIRGGTRGFVKVTRDLTQRRLDQLALEQARDEAVVINKLKSQLIATISHELRTPLSGVLSLSELIARDPGLDADNLERAARIFDAAKRLIVILNDLLDFAKLEAGKVRIENITYPLLETIDEVIGLTTLKAAEKGLILGADIGELPKEVCGDPNRVRQVLLNLINNAIKFTETGGVEVAVSLRKDNLHFSVTDTGIGISEAMQKKLFQPFVQAEGSTGRLYGGTGLGLSIAHQFVSLMGGKIGLFSKEHVGTTVWFDLPYKMAAAPK